MRQRVPHPATSRELLRVLKIPRDERTSFKRNLRNLVNDGALIQIKGNRYGLPDRMDLVVGKLDGHPSGFGFVAPERPVEGLDARHLRRRSTISGRRCTAIAWSSASSAIARTAAPRARSSRCSSARPPRWSAATTWIRRASASWRRSTSG